MHIRTFLYLHTVYVCMDECTYFAYVCIHVYIPIRDINTNSESHNNTSIDSFNFVSYWQPTVGRYNLSSIAGQNFEQRGDVQAAMTVT